MDFKLILTAFSAVFLAELADKTQLVGIGLSAKSMKPASVFLGSVTAYVIVTALSVFVGAAFGKFLSPEILRYSGGAVFILIGALILVGRI